MKKNTLIQLQKLVDSMPSQIFKVIKANGESTKYQIKIFPLYTIVLLLVLYLCQNKILKLSINHK